MRVDAGAPPLGIQLKFWVLGLRVPPECRPWVEQQLSSPHYSLRRFAGSFALYGGVFFVLSIVIGYTSGDGLSMVSAIPFVASFVGALVSSLVLGERTRRMEILYQRGQSRFGMFNDMNGRDFVLSSAAGLALAGLIILAFALFT